MSMLRNNVRALFLDGAQCISTDPAGGFDGALCMAFAYCLNNPKPSRRGYQSDEDLRAEILRALRPARRASASSHAQSAINSRRASPRPVVVNDQNPSLS